VHECLLRREAGANSLDNLSSGRHDAECGENSTVDDGLTVHEHFVLAIGAVLHLDIDPKVTSQLRRHTGGVQTGQSIRTITNDNPGHFELLLLHNRAWRPRDALVQLQHTITIAAKPHPKSACLVQRSLGRARDQPSAAPPASGTRNGVRPRAAGGNGNDSRGYQSNTVNVTYQICV